jgi:hypothetical protein
MLLVCMEEYLTLYYAEWHFASGNYSVGGCNLVFKPNKEGLRVVL